MLKYGDDYIMVQVKGSLTEDHGGIFAGGWKQLDECFGVNMQTLDNWCADFGYTYSISLYSPTIELVDNLYNVINENRDNNMSGEIQKLLLKFKKATY